MSPTMQRPQTLLAALFLGIAFAPHSGATVYQSDGSDANVQAIHPTFSLTCHPIFGKPLRTR